jgi:hypothetical protein
MWILANAVTWLACLLCDRLGHFTDVSLLSADASSGHSVYDRTGAARPVRPQACARFASICIRSFFCSHLLGRSIEENWLRLNSASKPNELMKERLSRHRLHERVSIWKISSCGASLMRMPEDNEGLTPAYSRYRALLDVSAALFEQPTVRAVLHSLRDVLSSSVRLHGADLYLLDSGQETLHLLEFECRRW